MATEYVYVGIRKDDGSMRAMSYDDEGAENEVAACVSDWIRRGLMVVRMSGDEYRARLSPTTPPPIPDLVQQVAAARADLSDADQTPRRDPRISPEDRLHDEMRRSFFLGDLADDDDAKTRLVHR